jgi:pre-mRNA-splicing factor SYF1
MCLQFANLEAQLGELDHARAALTYGAQMADPRRDPGYWKEWHAFEVAHGDEESFQQMLMSFICASVINHDITKVMGH